MAKNEKLLAMTQIAMLTAVMAVLSQIAVPMPSNVPLTLQTFAVSLCASLGGIRKGVPAILLYLLIGAVGLPVFSGFRGGIGVLFGYTGGFLWGFLPFALLCAWGTLLRSRAAVAITVLGGICLCHICGIVQYALVSGSGIVQSALLVSVPYLVKDGICAAAGCFAAVAVQRALHSAGLRI